jgi:hypothetical protein
MAQSLFHIQVMLVQLDRQVLLDPLVLQVLLALQVQLARQEMLEGKVLKVQQD